MVLKRGYMDKKFSLKYVIALTLVASALTCLVLFVLVGLPLGFGTELFGEVKEYAELRRYIDEYYIGEFNNVDLKDLVFYSAVYAIDDRWSFYLTADEYDEYINYSNNEYVGIGVTVGHDETTGGIAINGVYADSPADNAGIMVGDVVIAIDGLDITEMDYTSALEMIGGSQGETLTLTLIGEDGASRDVELVYQLIYKSPISSELIGDTGYVAIDNFEYGTSDDFIDAVEDLIKNGAKSLVFDVRGNYGGRVSELTAMLDYLLPEGDIFVFVDKNGKEAVTKSDASHVDLPMVVLIDANSYSAAEFFAAALSEYGVGITVGEKTTGKGRSQITIELSGGGALHISSSEYVTPKRVSLHETGGLTPEHEIALTEEQAELFYYGQLDKNDDPQFQKALEVLDVVPAG